MQKKSLLRRSEDETSDAEHRPLRREHAAAARAGQSENFCLKIMPAHRETNDSHHWANHSFLSLPRFAGFLMQRIENGTEQPSRRAGGAFGHSVRGLSNDTCDTQYRPLRREHADAARAGQLENGCVRTK